MNEYREPVSEGDVEIDIIDMIFYFIKKWKLLVVFVIIGLIAGYGAWAVKSNEAQSEAAEKVEKTEEEYVIDSSTFADMEVAYDYRRLYYLQKEYNENSLIMNLDPTGYYEGKLRYYIFGEEDVHLLGTLFNNVLYEEEFYNDMARVSGLDCGEEYIKEIISFSSAIDSGASVNVNAANGSYSGSAVRGMSVTYTIVSPDEESCSKMLVALADKVALVDEYCAEEYKDYYGIMTGEAVQLVSDPSYFSTQNSYINQMNTYLSNAEKIEDGFNDEEMEYYKKAFWNVEYVEESAGSQSDEIAVVEVSRPSRTRYFLFGVIGAVVVWGCIYLLKYLFNKNVRSAGEVRDTYRVPVLGLIECGASDKKPLAERLYARFKGPSDSAPYVASVISSLGTDQIVLCGDEDEEDVKGVMDELSGGCPNADTSGFAGRDSESLKKVKEAGSEILVVRVGKTKRSDVIREIELCSMQSINLLGIVTVDD